MGAAGSLQGSGAGMGIIDHVGLAASDFDRSLAFYSIALKPLGVTLIVQFPADGPAGQAAAGFGREGKPELWITPGGPVTPRIHLALIANSRAEVDAFYDAARGAGGIDYGRACAPTTIRTIMGRTSSTRMVTISRRSVTFPPNLPLPESRCNLDL
jgi:catechol 2,3-dioxygenase-like lactoylglutathione lyase family enzyme